MSEERIIEIKDIKYRYPHSSNFALNGFSFSIKRGEFVVITGATGSGKTTLALAILGIIPKKFGGYLDGEIKVFNQNVSTQEKYEIEKKIVFIFQDPGIQFISLRVREELLVGLDLKHLKERDIEQKIEKCLRLVGLDGYALRSPQELSAGQKQKVAIASALMKDAEIFILDEPFSMLDLTSKNEIIQSLQKIKSNGKTIIIISHNISPIIPLVDKIIVLNNGVLIKSGNTREVLYSREFFKVEKSPLPLEIAKKLKSNYKPITVGEFIKDIGKIQSDFIEHPSKKQKIGKTVLQFEDVSYKYPNGFQALNNINLDIKDGEYLSIIGPNGSGKSTLAFLANGILKPTTGKVYLFDKATTHYNSKELASRVGVIFQNPTDAIFREKVIEEVRFAPHVLGFEDIEVKVKQSMKLLEIYDIKDKDPLRLSYGQQKKTVIASILSMNSKIIIIDEPDLGIDQIASEKLFELFNKLNNEGKIIISITHNMNYVYRYAPRTILLYEGKILADGHPRDILHNEALLKKAKLEMPEMARLIKH